MSEVMNKSGKESAVEKTTEKRMTTTTTQKKSSAVKKTAAKTARKKSSNVRNNNLKNKSSKENTLKKNTLKNRGLVIKMPNLKNNNSKIILGVVAVFILVLILGVSSCGVSHKSPKGVVKSLVESYSDGKSKKALKCFGAYKEATEDLKREVEATIKYFKAHNAKKVEIDQCDILSENENYTYVYVIYDFVMEDGQIYPCISTYMIKNESGKYYVVPPAEVTAEMSEQAVVDYEKFMTTDIYKKYTQEYETFTKKNPGYENRIAGKLS